LTGIPPFPQIEFSLTVGLWSIVEVGYLDTGFEGGVAIPLGVGREIIAEPDRSFLKVANDQVDLYRTWTGTIDIAGHEFYTDIVALGSRYLIGRGVLDKVGICFEYGREVVIRF
jgi:predicted aspartyl protease